MANFLKLLVSSANINNSEFHLMLQLKLPSIHLAVETFRFRNEINFVFATKFWHCHDTAFFSKQTSKPISYFLIWHTCHHQDQHNFIGPELFIYLRFVCTLLRLLLHPQLTWRERELPNPVKVYPCKFNCFWRFCFCFVRNFFTLAALSTARGRNDNALV